MADQKVNIDIRTKGAKKAGKDIGGLNNAITKMGKAVGIASAAYFGAKGLISGFQRVIDLSATSDVVTRSFNNLAKSSNFSSQAFEKFQKATNGTVGSIELMTQANNAMLLGITDSEDQMAEMFDIAQRLASALGKDTAFGVESLVTGLGRQSKLMLDNLGIMVDTEKANEDYASSLGTTVDKLTDQQKKQAFVNATIDSARELVNNLGEEQLTTNDATAQLDASLENLGIAIGQKLSPIVKTLAQDFTLATTSLTEFIGPEAISREEQLQMLLERRSQLVKDTTEKTQEAVYVNDLFTDSALEQSAVEKENIDIGIESIDKQIGKFQDLLFTKKEDLEISRQGIDMTVKAVETNSKAIMSNGELTKSYFHMIGSTKAFAFAVSSAAQLNRNASHRNALIAKRAAQVEAVVNTASAVAEVLPNIPLALTMGALGAVQIAKIEAAKFADGGIVQGDPSKGDAVPALLTAGELILNASQQQGLLNSMGGVTVNIQGNMIGNEEFVRDTLIPEIDKTVNRGLA